MIDDNAGTATALRTLKIAPGSSVLLCDIGHIDVELARPPGTSSTVIESNLLQFLMYPQCDILGNRCVCLIRKNKHRERSKISANGCLL